MVLIDTSVQRLDRFTVVGTLMNILSRKTKKEDEYLSAVRFEIQHFLNESPRNAKKISIENEEFRSRSQAMWTDIVELSFDEIESRIRTVEIPELTSLVRFLDLRSEGVILSPIHMGEYLFAILAIVVAMPKRKVLILRRNAKRSERERRVFSKLAEFGVEYQVVRLDETAGIRVMQCLRNGGLVVMFMDLSGHFGKTLPLTVLGNTVRWVSGPAWFAKLTGAYVVSLVCYRSSGTSFCDILRVEGGRRSKKLETSAIAQLLASSVEGYLREYPAQWLHWLHLLEMFERPRVLELDPSNPHFQGRSTEGWI